MRIDLTVCFGGAPWFIFKRRKRKQTKARDAGGARSINAWIATEQNCDKSGQVISWVGEHGQVNN